MRARVFFTVAEVDPALLQDRTVVVIDVLRATSSVVAALAAGARAIYPVAGAEEAIRLASSLGREDTLLCGERKGHKVAGFDLGNSPPEFTPERVEGKRLVMSTTNGTRAFQAASTGRRVLAASLLNLDAVARELAGVEDLVVVCAGREDRFAIEDALCAGLLLERLLDGDEGEMDDAARASLLLARALTPDAAFLRSVEAGQALLDIGLGDDVEHCARRDVHAIVPEMRDRMIRKADGT
ncbi:MAG TPA: 2-phosphosulfolactate phosphatase [Candidatus Thermoplasmatota archaeon]